MDVDIDSSVTIRRAELRDVHAIMKLDRRVHPVAWSEPMTIKQTTGHGRLHFVVEIDPGIVAHGGVAVLAGDAHVTNIAVDPGHQRCGYGTAILGRLFEAAETNGCRGITLEVRASNSPALALYQAAGFTSAGVRPHYYQNNKEDAVIMWKELTNATH